ncbi:MAG: nucleoside-diphosphate kinase [Puniceicoccales bacterium]|jgi:nucleoside-diphosphate kinase|nr:nucleoside-diphosphate kinase [Puniceicoccales bacterium]
MERTLIIFKPDAMEQALVGRILARFEAAHLRIVAMKMIRLDDVLLREHYAHLAERPFFGAIVAYMTSRPVVIAVLEGEGAIAVVREMTGATDPSLAEKGTIRRDFGKDKTHNVIHSSDSQEGARAEIKRFFKADELF